MEFILKGPVKVSDYLLNPKCEYCGITDDIVLDEKDFRRHRTNDMHPSREGRIYKIHRKNITRKENTRFTYDTVHIRVYIYYMDPWANIDTYFDFRDSSLTDEEINNELEDDWEKSREIGEEMKLKSKAERAKKIARNEKILILMSEKEKIIEDDNPIKFCE